MFLQIIPLFLGQFASYVQLLVDLAQSIISMIP